MLYSNYLRDKSQNAIKIEEVEGNPCIIEKSKGRNLKDYKIYGNSYQATRSGRNLLPYPYSRTTTTTNGVTFTDNGDGSVTVNGTATANATWYFYSDTKNLINGLKIGDTVTVSIDCDKTWVQSPATMNIVCNYYNSETTMKDGGCVVNSTTKYKTITIGDDWVGIGFYIVVYNGQTIDNITLKPQVELGSVATEYEQYGVLPSPDYPSEIQSVGDLVSSGEHAGKYKIPVSVRGKNIWNNNTLNLAAQNTKTETGFIVTDYSNVIKDGSVFKEEAQLKVGDIIRFSYIVIIRETPSGSIGSVYFGSLRPVAISLTPKGIGTYQVISDYVVTSLDFNNVRFYGDSKGKSVEYKNVQIIKVDAASYKLIVNEGNNIDWNYEPYVEPITTNIYLNEPLRKVGDYADYIDFKNQKVVRQIKEITFDGTENWAYQESSNIVYLSIMNNNLSRTFDGYSTHFRFDDKTTTNPYF